LFLFEHFRHARRATVAIDVSHLTSPRPPFFFLYPVGPPTFLRSLDCGGRLPYWISAILFSLSKKKIYIYIQIRCVAYQTHFLFLYLYKMWCVAQSMLFSVDLV
jgi:hypothetical protein